MKYLLKPKTSLEIFGNKIYNLLVENFSRTYLVGGTVRDLILKRKISDIDIATEARPEQIAETLKKYFVATNLSFLQHGVIVAVELPDTAAIATFRKESYSKSRYPKIKYIRDPKEDSIRRDFTINALYLSAKNGQVLDFHGGLGDIKKRKIRFIGESGKRIVEDPLRIIRALRFCADLKFTMEKETAKAIKENYEQVFKLNKNKIKSEISKIKNVLVKNKLEKNIFQKKSLDKSFF